MAIWTAQGSPDRASRPHGHEQWLDLGAAVNVEWSWWERRVYQLFMRWPVVGLCAPMLIGLAVVVGVALLVGHFGEGRIWARDPEATAMLFAGEAAVLLVGFLSFIGMAAVMNRAPLWPPSCSPTDDARDKGHVLEGV